MHRIQIVWALLFLISGNLVSHAQINQYQFVVVPKKFQEFQQENQYHTSTLLKYLFTEEGFTAYYEGEIPAEVTDLCKGLDVGLLDESNMFRTRVVITLSDCKGKEVFRSPQGDSREKELKDGYQEAIEGSFSAIAALNYTYKPKKESVTMNFDNDVRSVAPEKETKAPDGDAVVVQEATPEQQKFEDRSPKPSSYEMQESTDLSQPAAEDGDIWYAQPIPNGYQLVDRIPEIRLRIYETSVGEVFLAESPTIKGLVFQKDGRWYLEYYKGEERIREELRIKF